MLLPQEDEIGDTRLAEHLEFPFTFDELEGISVETAIPQFVPPKNMKLILEQMAGDQSVLKVQEKEGVLCVSVI